VSPKVLDGPSRQAIAARVRFYRELGIYDLYRREIPEGMSFGRVIEREELARAEERPDTANSPGAPGPVPLFCGTDLGLTVLQDKPAALHVIREEIGDCTRCKLSRCRTNIVFGVGDPQARIMFVGEGPGADEDAQGEPFVGRAGQLLNGMLRAIGLKREQVYIANVLKCRPPHNRDPVAAEAMECLPYLDRQIALLKPKIMLVVGRIAAQNLLRTDAKLGALRQQVHRFGASDVPLVVTYHPAYLLRSPAEKRKAWEDLKFAREVFARG
jgi:DNA polymerase